MEYTRSDAEGQGTLKRAAETGEPRDILADIVASKRVEVAAMRGRARELRGAALDRAPARGFGETLRVPGEVRLLAEVKRRSPSAGPIRPEADPAEVAAWYRDGGAAALSVLTDERYFGGSLGALVSAREAVDLPILRKDFLIDEVQVWEARAAGADAVLLIARILDDDRLAELHGVAAEAGLDTLVEVHDGEELDRALAIGARVIGVNNRDLRTFRTDLGLTLELAGRIPAGVTLVAESGIRDRSDVERLGAVGVDAVLVGESLMRQPDVRAAAAGLVGVAKREVRR